jgi:hypothetical protein
VSDNPLPEEEPPAPSLLDVVVFAPIDAAFNILGDPRGAAARGKARVGKALSQARTLGELSLRFGASEIRRRTEGGDTGSDATATSPAPTPRHDAGPPPNDVIADYDALSASQIVPLLAGLDATERERVTTYEVGARARQTILQRLSQLDEADG